MRKLSEIAQLPVMEILNGKIVGKVRDIVVNPDTKEALMVMDEGVFSDFHILQKGDVQGIGRDFIMIKTKQAIQSSRENPELAKALTEYYSIMGLLVITADGNIVSKIEDVSIDEQSWQIMEIMLEDGKVYQKGQLLSMSEKYVFVQGEAVEEVVEEEEVVEASEEDYLVGMVVQEDVTGADEEVLFAKGTVLTKEMVAEAKEKEVLAELIMNAE